MPPLNALRAFEAAARTGSFTKAAVELNVTPAAVAQQVKSLEGWLGCPLFDRLSQGLRLSVRGRAALPALVHAFDALGAAVRELNRVARPGQIEIAALPAVATLWLAPRLAALRRAFPQTTVSITAMETPPNLDREPYDLALFSVPEAPPDSMIVKLHDDRITPVCSPGIAPVDGEEAVDWLRRQTLLHDSVWRSDWPVWLQAAGVTGIAFEEGAYFSLYSVAVQAALDGAGVLIGHEALIGTALRHGDLVAPFPLMLRTGQVLAAIVPEQAAPLVRQLAAWLASDGSERS
jgi:LysR family transcriptional regulator, glycine cleavage system transcriptional activator